MGPKRQNNGLSRCDGWIGAAKLPPENLPRAPTDVWDPFFEHFAQKCEGFSPRKTLLKDPPLIKRPPPSDVPLGSLKLAQNSPGQTLLHKPKRGAAPKAPPPVSGGDDVLTWRVQTVFRSERSLNSLNAEHCFLNTEQCSGPTLLTHGEGAPTQKCKFRKNRRSGRSRCDEPPKVEEKM